VIRSEIVKWAGVVEQSGAKADGSGGAGRPGTRGKRGVTRYRERSVLGGVIQLV
jgi:hypothetical protein